jgi:polar amino acid transport system permease protein
VSGTEVAFQRTSMKAVFETDNVFGLNGLLDRLRYVIIPQGVRHIIPPLLNSFIGLQKDTALVNVIGSIDAFNQSIIIATNNFNLSPVTTVALLFIVITIPQARLVDRLIERDRRRMRIGS